MTKLTVAFRNFANAPKNRKFSDFCIEGLELRQISQYIDYATDWKMRNCDPIPSRTKRILSSPERHDPLWGPFCLAKCRGRDSSVEIKTVYSYASNWTLTSRNVEGHFTIFVYRIMNLTLVSKK